ncbi:12297_t:CDS:2 [Ambispora leptoticha]|uniref:12297_t:CDS:1 n=1 Tax=Ambispora leptoticha TaxID=144679 RepID=A0A9N9A586_9GLOM|nr:12297_t:CDS:2 [Ambispora leptoticha]
MAITLDDNATPSTVWVSDECDFPGVVNDKLQGCGTHPQARVVYIAVLAYTSVIFLTSLALLYYRVIFQGQLLRFPLSRGRGILRFRPLEAFQICVASFTLATIVDAICLIGDLYSNTSWALVGGQLPVIVGFSLSTLYPIGLLYATSSADESLSKESKLYNKYLIDTTGFFFLIGPAFTILPIRWIKGKHLIEHNQAATIATANWNTGIWTVWTILYLTVLFSFWSKLRAVLKNYIAQLKQRVLFGDGYRLRKILGISRHASIFNIFVDSMEKSAGINVFLILFRREAKANMAFMGFDVFEGLVGVQPILIIIRELKMNRTSPEQVHKNESSATKTHDTSDHPYLHTVKEKLSDAVHITAQKLNLEPHERHPEAYHQDGKTGPE